MTNIAVFLNNGPEDGGAFQYNQTIIDAFIELPQAEFNRKIFYTNNYWKDYLVGYPYDLIELKLSPRLNKILKLITYFKLPIAIRKALLYLLAPNVARHLNDEEIDLLIFPSQDTISLFTTVPKVSVIHDLMHRYESHFPEVSQNGRIKYRDRLFKAFCDEAKGIIVDSKVGSIHVQESYHISGENIYELPFLPPPYIIDQSPVPPGFGEKYQDLPSKFLFYPSQFWAHKNHKNLLLAVHSLLSEGISINLVFGGKLIYGYKDVAQLVEKLNLQKNITFLGYIPNEFLKGIYLKSAGLVMPTYFGPTNIPPLEAIFLGRPMAVSGIYGMPDQLGGAALYFNPNSVNEIAEKMKMLWIDENVVNDLIEQGKEVAKKWNKKEFNKRFNDIVKNLIVL